MRTLVGLIGVAVLVATAACADNDRQHMSGALAPDRMMVGSGHFITESRPVSGFSSIEMTGAVHATMMLGDVESMEIMAEDNVMRFVDARVVGGRLMIGMMTGSGGIQSHGITFRIVARELHDITASGASQIEMPGLMAAHVAVHLSGASMMTASGSVDRMDLDLSGASACRAADLATHAMTATLSGASTAAVRVDQSLIVTASGASLLEYFGNPPVVEQHTSSGAIVRRGGS
jgi:Putative auto-transporter adhesin, head GIN domain